MSDHGHHHDDAPKLYGVIAEFNEADDVLHAAEKAYKAGYRNMDAYSPYPVHGLSEALGFRKCGVSPITLIGGLCGTATAVVLQYVGTVVHYPYDIGGKPLFSWPSYFPILFELTILFGAFSALGSMLFLNGLPQPNHPIFNAKRFDRASSDGFFLCIEADDAQFDQEKTKSFLAGLHPVEVSEVYDEA